MTEGRPASAEPVGLEWRPATEPTPGPNVWKTRLVHFVSSSVGRIAATIILLAIVVYRSQPQHLAAAAGRLGILSLLVAAALTLPFLYLKALRWQVMLRYAGSETKFGEAAISLIGGMGLALITPARLGEVARVAFLRDTRKLRLSGLVLLDKLFDVLVLVILSIPGAWLLISPIFALILAIVGLAGLALTLAPQLLHGLRNTLSRRVPLGGRTAEILGAIDGLSPGATLIYLGLTLGAFLVVILQFAIILHGARNVSPSAAFDTFPLVILTNILPLTIGGLGIREGAAILLLRHFHIAAALAAISAFAMFFLNTALPGLVGALIPAFRRRLSQPAGRS